MNNCGLDDGITENLTELTMSEEPEDLKEDASFEMCKKYIAESKEDSCVHCWWFSWERTTAFYVSQEKNDDPLVECYGQCERYPPTVLVIEGRKVNARPNVRGTQYCGEHRLAMREAEDICEDDLIPENPFPPEPPTA